MHACEYQHIAIILDKRNEDCSLKLLLSFRLMRSDTKRSRSQIQPRKHLLWDWSTDLRIAKLERHYTKIAVQWFISLDKSE
jgi:hypothetical protein